MQSNSEKNAVQKRKPSKSEPEKPSFHLSDLFLKSDLHGLPDWYEARDALFKIIWTVILILSIAFLIFFLVKAGMDFHNNPVLTTYSLLSDPSKLNFPHVYLCPLNPVHEKTRWDKNVDEEWEKVNVDGLLKAHSSASGESGLLTKKSTMSQMLVKYFPDLTLTPSPTMSPIPGASTESINVPPEPWIPDDIQDYFMETGYPIDTFLQECSWNAEQIPCKLITQEIFDGDYGKCFLIKPPHAPCESETENCGAKQKLAGTGLSLVLNLDWPLSNGKKHMNLFDGVVMKVDRFLDIGSQQFMLLAPGQYSHTTIEATKMEMLSRDLPDGGPSCLEDEGSSGIFKILNPPAYSEGACFQDCIQQIVTEECQCFMPVDKRFLKDAEEFSFCNVHNLTDCAYPAAEKNQGDIADCAKQCKMPCNLWQYRTETTAALFPSDNVKNTDLVMPPNEPVSEEELKKIDEANKFIIDMRKANDMIIVDVAFSSLRHIEVTQEKSMTFTSFVSNIGGLVGLFIGASIITLFKFFVLLIPLCLPGKNNKLQDNSVQLSSRSLP